MAQRDVRDSEVALAKEKSSEFLAKAGFLFARLVSEGRCIYLAPAVNSSMWRLGIARNEWEHAYYEAWDYEPDSDVAWRAALGWDGEGAPEGWIRHLPRVAT